MISLEALPKIIDTTQLTADLEGTLNYDHASWLETRLAVEEFAWQAADLLDRLDDLQEDLARSDFADDVSGAKHKIDQHNEMKKKIMKAPVEDIDVLGNVKIFKINLKSIFMNSRWKYSDKESNLTKDHTSMKHIKLLRCTFC